MVDHRAAEVPPKPRALVVWPEKIPAELRTAPRWVGWKLVWRPPTNGKQGKWDKPPMDIGDGGSASSTNPATWATFDEALAAYQRGDLDGIGIVLHRAEGEVGPGLVGIDLDKCRDAETGELEPWAADIVRSASSYAEASPSGRGVRIFLTGELPPGRRRRGQVEMYDTARYLTVTGHRLDGAPTTVEFRQAELQALHAQVFSVPTGTPPTNGQVPSSPAPKRRGLIAKAAGSSAAPADLGDDDIVSLATRSKVGAEFNALMAGDISGHDGDASRADLALANHLAFFTGPNPDRIDRLFRRSGLMRPKWDERRGERTYGQLTVAKALEGRTEFYSSAVIAPADGSPVAGEGFRNFYTEHPDGKQGGKGVRRGYPIQTLARRLWEMTGGWPRRMNNLLFVEAPGPKPLWLETPAQLFAWVAGRLPSGQGGNLLSWATGAGMVTEAQYLAYLTQQAEAFDGIELHPHLPALSRHFYLHPPVFGGDGKALAELLARFNPATLIDADLIRAFLLSLVWGGPPGGRPAWLFTAEESDAQGGRGVGKSKLATLAARLFGGHIDLATNERMPDVITRLLSPDALERRVVLLDNIKTLRLSWAELEALVTTDSISGHRLYHGEGRRPNTLTYCLTLNGASLSRDMAQRCVIVKLARPEYTGTWEEDTIALIEGKRWHIIGDILAALRAPALQVLETHGRWGAWERAVLARVAEPAECQKVIAERQAEADDDSTEADMVRTVFVEELQARDHDVERDVIWVESHLAADWCNQALGEKRPPQRATTYLRTLGIPELRLSRRGTGRGWIWHGAKASSSASAMRLRSGGMKAEAVGAYEAAY